MADIREDNVYQAKLAEQAERYDGKIKEFFFNEFYLMIIQSFFNGNKFFIK